METLCFCVQAPQWLSCCTAVLLLLVHVAPVVTQMCGGNPGIPGIPGIHGPNGSDGPKGEKGDAGELEAVCPVFCPHGCSHAVTFAYVRK